MAEPRIAGLGEIAALPAHSIVVGIDGSSCSEEALRWALGQSRLTGQEVRAVIAWGYPLDVAVPGVGEFTWEAVAATVRQHVGQGHPARVLIDAAAAADVLVVGYRGRGGFGGALLASVTQRVVTGARCPVLVITAR